jgi:DNA-binding transcriptional LysR family regulator
MFDPRRLRVLQAIADHRSFTLAAEELSMTQPAVSRQVAALERELAVTLVLRNARRVALTAAGEALLAHAATILPAITAAAREIENHRAPDGGSVRVGAVPSALAGLVPDALSAFRTRRPRATVRVEEGWGDDLADRTLRGELDLALVSAAATTAAHDRTPLSSEQFHVMLRGDDPLAGATAIHLTDLRHAAWIVAPTPGGRREVTAACARAGFTPRITATAGWGATERLVAAGVGIALAPGSIATSVPGVTLRPLHGGPQRQLMLLRSGLGRPTPAAEELAVLLHEAAARAAI